MDNLSSRVHIRYLTRSLPSLIRYRCEHSKINSISLRTHELFSIYTDVSRKRKLRNHAKFKSFLSQLILIDLQHQHGINNDKNTLSIALGIILSILF